jgi:glycerol-3-phosphate dehydrogenase (NAD(P)+)
MLEGAEAIVCAVPAVHMRETCRRLAGAGYAGQFLVICTKGIEQGTLSLMHEVAQAELGPAVRSRLAVLSGPSHAEEVSLGMPTAVAVAAESQETAQAVQQLFMQRSFRVYTLTDVAGAELGGALKNVIAIACGISDGLGFGDNAKAALITRGLTEIIRLGLSLGARVETFYGLSGIGDLVGTAMSRHSRNWRFGKLLGEGVPAEEALERIGMVVEGRYTVEAAVALGQRQGVELPITDAVSAVLFHELPPLEAVSGLMLRDPKSEMRR